MNIVIRSNSGIRLAGRRQPILTVRFAALCVFALIVAGWGIAPLSAQPPVVEENVAEPAANQQLWMVSTRQLPTSVFNLGDAIEFRYWRHDGGEWLESNEQEFIAAGRPGVPTSLLIPGAPLSRARTFQLGKTTFDVLHATWPEAPLRMVVWTWPSDLPCRGQLRSYRMLAARCNGQAYYVGSFIDRYLHDCPVSLVGYSFGARIATGALQLIAGGHLACCPALDLEHAERPPINLVLMAAAMDTWWLNTNGCHSQALSQVNRALVTVNRCDPMLDRYHFLYQLRRGPVALGQYGVGNPRRLGEYESRYEELNVTAIVGSTHEPDRYLSSPEILSATASLVFFEEVLPAE